MPAVEYATLVLARECGLNVPDTQLIRLDGERAAMLIARFDREPVEGGFARRHMVLALTMLGGSELKSPDQSYEAIAGVISSRGAAAHVERDRIELFKRMVFNILVTNNDDHLRNHAFLYDAAGRGLAPESALRRGAITGAWNRPLSQPRRGTAEPRGAPGQRARWRGRVWAAT